MRERPSGTVTFLFTDIEGSTRLWEADPDAMRGALAAPDELLRSAIENQRFASRPAPQNRWIALFRRSTSVRDRHAASFAAQAEAYREIWDGPQQGGGVGRGGRRVASIDHARTGVALEADGHYEGFLTSFGSTFQVGANFFAGRVEQSAEILTELVDTLPPGSGNLAHNGAHRLEISGGRQPAVRHARHQIRLARGLPEEPM